MISLEDFQEYMSQHGKSENTIQTYLGHVKGYALWYEESYGREMTKLYHTNILDYRSYLQNIKRLKFNSINAKLSALSCFNQFLIETKNQEDDAVVSEDRLKFQQMIASPSDLEKPEVDEFLQRVLVETGKRNYAMATLLAYAGLRVSDDDDKIRLNQRKPSKYKGLSRFGPEKNLQRINKFMKERPIFYKNLIQMKENFRFYLRCFYCITKVVILQFNSENRTELARNG